MNTIKTPLTHIWISLALAASLSGCVSRADQNTLQNLPTMAEAYQAGLQDSQGNTLAKVRSQISNGNKGAEIPSGNNGAEIPNGNDVAKMFPTLPNPTLVMYVYPHLAGEDQSPVPGYFTAFSFYTEQHYAIPGEGNV